MKNILFTIVVLAFFNGCGNESASQVKIKTVTVEAPDWTTIGTQKKDIKTVTKKSIRAITETEQTKIRTDGLAYLNVLRQKAGMIDFKPEIHLNDSAYNHAHYLILNNTGGHSESSSKSGYTGSSPSERAIYAGYLYRYVSENVSTGNSSVTDSIDGLFAAIYHRLGFLSFEKDEIGIGVDISDDPDSIRSAYTYNMGISQFQKLCAGDSASSGYKYVCADDTFLVSVDDYNSARSENSKKNPSYVIWPYKNQKDALPAFYEESPDPLPECSVSGYPLSVQFNPEKNGEITVDSFKLFYDRNGTEITNTKFMDKESDPNSHFTKYEFALFPLERLIWDTSYRAEIKYREDGEEKVISWHYKTKSLPYPYYKVLTPQSDLKVKSGKTYLFYVQPEDCNDKISSFSLRYNGNLKVTNSFYDPHTFQITVTGEEGTVTISPSNGRDFTLTLSETDDAIYPSADSVHDDFNQDGRSDLFWRNDKGENHIWFMNDDGTHRWYPKVDKPTDFKVVGIGDFNGDGSADVFWRRGTENSIWFMNTDGSHKWYPKVDKPLGYEVAGIGDFNGDGRDDIFWRNGEENSLWLMNTDGTHIWKPQVSKPLDYKVAAIGDFNGDGKDDIFWRNGEENSLWFMNEDLTHIWKPIISKPSDFKLCNF